MKSFFRQTSKQPIFGQGPVKLCYLLNQLQGLINLLLIARISSNMSQFSLPENGIFNAGSLPCFGQTLQLIQTKKHLPNAMLSFFDQDMQEKDPEPLDDQNSLGISLNVQLKSEAEHTEAGTTPKKKRTGCICKKTKCLKMYCECFASGKLCTPQCSCYGCSNHENCEQIVEKAKENIKQKNQLSSNADTLKQFKGCNCKKSQCQKKYCQCFNAGVPCGAMCKCQQCANGDGTCSQHSIKESKEV